LNTLTIFGDRHYLLILNLWRVLDLSVPEYSPAAGSLLHVINFRFHVIGDILLTI